MRETNDFARRTSHCAEMTWGPGNQLSQKLGYDSAASGVIAFKFRAKVITRPKRKLMNVNMSDNSNVISPLILLSAQE